MTLIVAGVSDNVAWIVADTLLSYGGESEGRVGPINGKSHALKVHILNPDTAIAYAGSVDDSIQVISALTSELKNNPEIDVSNWIYSAYQNNLIENKNETDFLLLQLTANGRKLSKITAEGIFPCAQAYIGDANAYSELMRLWVRYEPPAMQSVQQSDGSFVETPLVISESEINFHSFTDAMEKLVQGKKSPTVGGICDIVIRVVDAKISQKFEYLQSVITSTSPAEKPAGHSVLASNSGTRGIGIYFRNGKFGYAFIAGDEIPCHKIDADTIHEFIIYCEDQHGLHLT